MSAARVGLVEARRLVLKIGSRSLMHGPNGRFDDVAEQIARAQADGRSVVLVSSGAVALGRRRLGMSERPRDIARLQAAAAAGQSLLMRAYEDAFEARGIHVAQVLLSHADLEDRDRYLNARAAIAALLELGVVPIINENDTVAVDEIRFGDNDQLAAMVSTLVGAELLVLLTDVEGLLDAEGKRVPLVGDAGAVADLVRPSIGDEGLGGMASKLEAAGRASRGGVPVVVGDARMPGLLAAILAGEDVGTLVLPAGTPMASRKHWIAFTLKPRGDLLVDAGAMQALREGKRSLLPAGLMGVRGEFEAGEAVRIVGPQGEEIARGLARYGTLDVARLCGARTAQIPARIGRYGGDEIVHRDDLVVI
ncbi:MAG: glutamate 5-kinase [Myxococcales bacterium]|nr:glutamate 5-kinase [Myxococcales bacterium]